MGKMRFKNATGVNYQPWAFFTLGELCKISTGKNKPSFENGKYIIMDMGSVDTNGTILEHKLTDDDSDLLDKGSLIMPKDDIGGGMIICKVAVIPENNRYVLGDHVFKLTSDKCNPLFLKYLINSERTNNSLKRKVTGSAQLGINASNISNEIVEIPESKEEQEKIGGFLSSFDKLIQKRQEKICLLQELKKGYLHEMFPEKGSNTPKIRFNKFTDAWKQYTFGDKNELITGYPFESDNFLKNGIKLVRGTNVKRGYLDFSEAICARWHSSLGLEKYLLMDKDILIQMDGALIGQSYAIISEEHLPALLVQRVTRARSKKEVADSDFMYQAIQRDFLNYIEKNKTETAVPHLSLNDIKHFGIMVPRKSEQNRVGIFLSTLDNLITFHQRKLEGLEEMKKGYMQRLFA